MDAIDHTILTMLQENARNTNTEIAKKVNMAPSGVLERIRKLESQGIITGYAAQLNAQALEFGLAAFVFVKTDDRVGETKTAKLLAEVPDIQEVHHIAGEDCFIIKVRARDTVHLAELLREKIGKIETVRSTRTTIVLETIKETSTLPLGHETKERKT